MLAKLQLAINANRIVVQKLVSGEVMVKFHSLLKLPDLILNTNQPMDLLARKGITLDAVRKSNIEKLIAEQYIKLV